MESQLGLQRDTSQFQELSPIRNKWPSWSWASVTGPISDSVQWVSSKTAKGVKIISCDVIPLYPEAPLGQVISGRLKVEAFVVEARYADGSWFEDTSMDFDGLRVNDDESEGPYCMLLGCSKDNTHDMHNPVECQWDGLFLRRISDGVFQRMGYFSQGCWDDTHGIDAPSSSYNTDIGI
jgi:hypothetical protein